MRNLLWKFVALIGVTGVGFMVVLQVMKGLSGVPDLPTQQTAAASDEPGTREEPSPESPAERVPELPPLRTKETVAMANPFPPLAEPETQPAGAVHSYGRSPEPVPVDAFAGSSEPVPEEPFAGSAEPTPVDNPPFPSPQADEPTPAEIPFEFPAATESPSPSPTSAGPPVPELGGAEMPILVPMVEESAGPDLGAFSEGPTPAKSSPVPADSPTPATSPGPIAPPSLGENNPFTDPVPADSPTPATSPGPIAPPSLGENNPFTDPVPTRADEGPQTPENSYDPYEPLPGLPAGQAPTPAEPVAPQTALEPPSSRAPAEPAAPEDPLDFTFPTLEPRAETSPEPASPSSPSGDEAPKMNVADVLLGNPQTADQPTPPVQEPPADADPLDNLPLFAAPELQSEPAPQTGEPQVAESELPSSEPPSTEAPSAGPPKQERGPDPFLPKEPSVPNPPTSVPPPKEPPGRATVRTPTAGEQTPKPAPPMEPAPEPAAPAFPESQPSQTPPRREIPYAPTPTPEASIAPMPPVEKPSPDVKPLPNITAPLVAGPDMPSSAPGPEGVLPEAPMGPDCAVPVVAVSEGPPANAPPEAAPFVDPLDQLTFPNAAPPAAERPDQQLIPTANNSPAVPEIPAEPQPNPDPLPEINPRPLNVVGQTPPTTSPQPGPSPSETPSEKNTPVTVAGLSPSGPQQPKLKIEKTAPPKAVLNQPMIYNIVVRNVGANAAHQVIVEDQVPEGTTLTGTIPRGEIANNRLIWRLGILNPGEEKKIAVRVIPTQEGQVGSVAKVSFVAEVAAQTVVASPKLKLEMSGPGDAVIGDALTYHFQIENNGSGDATKVFLRNVLPEGLRHPSGDDLEYEVGLLKAGEKKEIDLTVNAAKAGEFSNTAMLVGSGGLKAEASAKVKILGDRLTITRTGPKRRYVGRQASYSNTVANQSDRKVQGVRVIETVPPGMEFVQASAGGQYDPNQRTVTWTIAELGPKANQLLQLELLAKAEGPQASQVIAVDPNGSRAVVKSETTVDGYTALRLDVAEYNDPVDVGEQVGLRVVATNRGTRATTNAVVKLTLPEEMEFVSAKGPVDFKRDGQTLTFNPIPSLDARGETTFDLVLKSTKAGDARIRLEIASDQMAKPLLREEGIRILAKRP